MKRLALGWVLAAAAAAGAQTPASDNAALSYYRAFALLEPLKTELESLVDHSGKILDGEEEYVPDAWEDLFAECAPAFREMDRAAAKKSCDFGFEYGIADRIPHLARARYLARVNSVWALHLAASGRGAQAVPCWRRGFRLAQHVSENGSSIFGLVGIAISGITMASIATALRENWLDAAALDGIEKILSGLPYGIVDMASCMRGEKRSMMLLFRSLQNARDPMVAFDDLTISKGLADRLELLASLLGKAVVARLPVVGASRGWRQFADDVQVMDEQLDIYERLMAKPYDEARERLLQADRFEKRITEDKTSHPMAAWLLPAVLPEARSRMKMEAKRRGVLAMARIRQFEKKEKRPLEKIDPFDVPLDTCSGKPMAFEIQGFQYVLTTDVDETDEQWKQKSPFEFGIYILPR